MSIRFYAVTFKRILTHTLGITNLESGKGDALLPLPTEGEKIRCY